VEIYHHTIKDALESARVYVLEKFPWITRDHSHLKAGFKDGRDK